MADKVATRDRFTDLMVLVDPHIVPVDDADLRERGQWLMQAVNAFVTPAVLKATVPCADPSKLRRAQLLGASVEVGDKYGRVHIHFNLNLMHRTTVYLKHPDGRTINDSIQTWFNERLGKSCFVSVRLADTSRAKNYATKSGGGVDGGIRVGRTPVGEDKS